MEKIRTWIRENVLFLCTLILLVLIPLYPKLPLLDIQNTWVYIRVEDFVVAFVLLIWIALLFLKKVTLKTPLTLPIMVFWIVGGLATLHGVFFLFLTLEGVHANVAFLSFLRRIEYMSLFFIAYASISNKKNIFYVIAVLVAVLLLVIIYGFGQRFLGFPAYLTMNEEFAKGIPIQLSALSRISSTFAGHYDLAAYLVLMIPIMTSLAFGFKNWIIKISLLITVVLGFILLFMTVSRVSFIVLLLSLGVVLYFQKKRLVIISLFVLLFMLSFFSAPLLQRFASTVSEVEVLVNATTGSAIGPVKEVSKKHFDSSVIFIQNHNQSGQTSTISAILDHSRIPEYAALVVEPNVSTGENLPQGTSYINLSLSPVKKKVGLYFFEKTNNIATKEADVYFGDYVIKKAKAYDLSFTTRFQGEWPRTIEAFQKNIFLGSGYGAVSLAVDNNYLRILGESGLLGLLSFLSIFIFAGVYIKRTLPNVDSPVIRNFVLGFIAGTLGLALNAILIDVFEASKIAFTYWLLMGITLGLLHLYAKGEIDLIKEFKRTVSSTYALVIYLFVITVGLFSSVYQYYFVAADFMWLKLASFCYSAELQNSLVNCQSGFHMVISLLSKTTDSLYRPGTVLYFYFMHTLFWLNQTMYHIVAILLYFAVAVVVLLISKNIFKNQLLSFVSAGLFLVLAGHSDVILGISSMDILLSSFFTLLGILFFIYWQKKSNDLFLILSLFFGIISPFFHESAIVFPLFILLYDIVFGKKIFLQPRTRKKYIFWYTLPVALYGLLRLIVSGNEIFNDVDFFKLFVNNVMNMPGYVLVAFLGPNALSYYEGIRSLAFRNTPLIIVLLISCILAIVAIYRFIVRKLAIEQRRIFIFGFGFFAIAILPFLGIDTVIAQYSYLPNVGLVILLTFCLKELFVYLRQNNDTWTVIGVVMILSIIFSMAQIFQIQAAQNNRKLVSERSERFLISFNEHFLDSWKNGNWKFYFVNVPRGYGQAWSHPQGLHDALWFVTQNPQIALIVDQSLSNALDAADSSSRVQVFEFQPDGSIKGVIRKVVNGRTFLYKK